MGKVVGTVLKVVGVVALTVATFGSASVIAAIGISATTLATAGAIAFSIGSGLLAKDKAQKAARSARAEQIRAMVNPQAKANWVFGETATAVQIVYSEVMGSKKDKAVIVYAGPAHEIDSYGQLYINDEAVNFSGANATGSWSGAVSRYTNFGDEDQIALSVPGSTWPASARGRGFAHFALLWHLDHDKLKDGVPDRITQVVKAVPVYDPRLDSTVGGSGTQRANDQSTWVWTSINGDAGANWSLVVLHYILGWKNNGKLVYGRGADPEDINMASFISTANVCDELVDGIPRYHIGGIERIDGDHDRVIASLEATIGGMVAKPGGIYHIWAPHDDLVAIETISENDLIRDVGVNFQDARSIENIFNVGVGQFINPDTLYQPDSYPEVREEAAITEHGRERVMPYDTAFLQDHRRSQRVVLQQIRRSLFGRVWQLGVGPKFFRRNIFDVLNLNIEETNFTDTFVRITNKQLSPNGLIIYTLEEENSLIYDVMAPLGTLASRNVPPTFDGSTKIPVTSLDVIATAVTGTSGTASDALRVSYDDPGPLVNRTDIEFQISGVTDWQPAASKVLDAGVAIISSVEPGTTYYVRVRHWTVFDVPSGWVTDFVVAGQSKAIDYDSVTGGPPSNATAGHALNTGSGMDDLTKWFGTHTEGALTPDWTTVTLTDGVAGSNALQVVDNNNDADDLFSEKMALDQNLTYKVSVWARQPTGDRINYLLVTFYDENGDIINNISTPVSNATGWNAIGTYHYWGQTYNEPFPVSFEKHEAIFGREADLKPPTNAVSMRIGGLISRAGTTETTIHLQEFKIEQYSDIALPAVKQQSGVNLAPVSFWGNAAYSDNSIVGISSDDGVTGYLTTLGLSPGDTITAAMYITAETSDTSDLIVRTFNSLNVQISNAFESSNTVPGWVVVTQTIPMDAIRIHVRTNTNTGSFYAEKISLVRGFYPLGQIRDTGTQLIDPNDATILDYSQVVSGPPPDATNNTLYRQESTPTGSEGDIWYKPSTKEQYEFRGASWQIMASYNSGNLADLDTVAGIHIDADAVDIDKILDGAVSLQSFSDTILNASIGAWDGLVDVVSLTHVDVNPNRVHSQASFIISSSVDANVSIVIAPSIGGGLVKDFDLVAGKKTPVTYSAKLVPALGNLGNTHTLSLECNTVGGVLTIHAASLTSTELRN